MSIPVPDNLRPPRIERRQAQSDHLLDHVPALLARIYAARHVRHPDELQLLPAELLPPGTLLGMEPAIDLLCHMLEQQGRILIISDFDADGATSCVLLLRALRMMGFAQLDYIVPDRFIYGYGLSPDIARLAVERRPDLIVTVDNGISSHEGVSLARAAGVQVLITDHHLAPDELPDANAIVNPNQPGCSFGSKALAGVGVAFYLMLGLRARLRTTGWFQRQGIAEPRLADLLDLVALGTVADLVPLDRNNRILVHEGLRRIRAGRACPGILALLQVAGRSAANLVAADLGFAVGPRLNAAGRLEDMSLGIACLLTDDPAEAQRLATELNTINQTRRAIEAEMRDQAMAAVTELQQRLLQQGDELPAALVLYEPSWHQGVVGIVASRIKDCFHRPVIVFADAGDAENIELKGSARSVSGLHIRDLLDEIASRQPGLINRFGGHAMAAGLSLDRQMLPAFMAAVEEAARRHLDEELLQRRLLSDGALTEAELVLSTAEMLRQAGPWGQAFPEPQFDGEFRVVGQRLLAERHLKLTLMPLTGEQLLDAIAFNIDTQCWPDNTVRQVRLVYRLDVNEFRGQRQLQLMVEHVEPVPAPAAVER